MRWLKTGRQIGQAVKNAHRLSQIVSVLGRHGFDDVVERVHLGRFLSVRSKKGEKSDRTMAERLRLSFEELGPTFVKLGQLLSTRPDIIPESFVREFTKLQDDVLPLPFDKIKKVIESQLERPISEVFSSINEEPLASASIAQVHEAVLPTGENVVIKVQRPGIQRTVETDVALLEFVANLLEKHFPETRIIAPTIIVEEFFRTISQEMDFMIEANNMIKMASNMSSYPEIAIPKVYRDRSTQRILVIEKFDGIPLNDGESIAKADFDRKGIVAAGAKSFVKSVLSDGLFHGDLHGGNLFLLPGNRLGIIDFGIVGRLPGRARGQLANLLIALLQEDFEQLCYQYVELGRSDPSSDVDGFQREIRNALAPYLGLNISEVNSGKILIETTRIATKYQIRAPGEWMLVFKAILTMESMGRSLDPTFNVLDIGEDLLKDFVKDQYSLQRISKELLWIGKDFTSLLQVMPRQFRWMLRKFNQNEYAIEIKSPELKEIQVQLDKNSKRSTLGVLSAGFLISAAVALQFPGIQEFFGVPVIALGLFVFGLFAAIRSISI